MTTANLYLLKGGTYASPENCAKGADGVLRSETGVDVVLNEVGEPTSIAAANATNAKASGKDATEAAPAPAAEPAHVEPAPEVQPDSAPKTD